MSSGTNESGQSLTDAVAEVPPVFDSARNQSYALYGYPAAGKFNGQRMYVCNTAWSRNDTSATPATMGVPCDMTGGSSGGGWVTAAGSVASVVSYGYSNLKNVLFGPHQETEAQQLYSAAQAPTNLVSDPGFESGTSGFDGYQATVAGTTSEHHSGSSALQIVTQANQPFANGHMSATAPGGIGVTLDIWVKAPPGYNHTVYVNSWDAGFRWLSSPIWQVATGNGTWQHFTASGTLHADTAYLEYGVGDPGSGQPQATL